MILHILILQLTIIYLKYRSYIYNFLETIRSFLIKFYELILYLPVEASR